MDWPTEIGTACYIRRDGKTLFFYRNRGEIKDMHHGNFVPPGGHNKRSERGIDCVIREVKEETGLTIRNPKLRQIVMFYNKDRILGGKRDRPDWYVEVYETSDFEGELELEKKGDRLVWVEDLRISEYKMYDCDRRMFELLAKEGVYAVLVKYNGEEMERFDYTRIA